jgi:hypothetical protein
MCGFDTRADSDAMKSIALMLWYLCGNQTGGDEGVRCGTVKMQRAYRNKSESKAMGAQTQGTMYTIV